MNTSDERLTTPADISAFNRLKEPEAPHRVILLVNKGTEGWNCPILFACALVRKLTTSNNFVLQAASRCLRRASGNRHKARVYLSQDNFAFTGALTDPAKTDFYVEYKDDKGKWRRYTPDFVIRRKDGKTLIVEVKREHDREHPVDGERGRKALALRKWEDLNPDRLRYEMIFTSGDTIPHDHMTVARAFVKGMNRGGLSDDPKSSDGLATRER